MDLRTQTLLISLKDESRILSLFVSLIWILHNISIHFNQNDFFVCKGSQFYNWPRWLPIFCSKENQTWNFYSPMQILWLKKSPIFCQPHVFTAVALTVTVTVTTHLIEQLTIWAVFFLNQQKKDFYAGISPCQWNGKIKITNLCGRIDKSVKAANSLWCVIHLNWNKVSKAAIPEMK